MLQAPAFTTISARGNRNHKKHKGHKTSFSISRLADPMILFVPFAAIQYQAAFDTELKKQSRFKVFPYVTSGEAPGCAFRPGGA